VLAAAGETVRSTATKLGISPHTVNVYMAQAKMKLQATSKAHLVALYLGGTGDDHRGERVGTDD
jgi:DNA-binding CsgD family transcriptional regulator